MNVFQAIESGDLRKAEALLARPEAIQQQTSLKESPLHVAASTGNDAMVRLVLAHGGDVAAAHYRKQTPLHVAAGLGHRKVVQTLLEHHADASARDTFKKTPLHAVAGGGGASSEQDIVAVVEALGNAGAEIDALDSSGRSPLWFAAHRGSKGVVAALLSRGANPTLRADGTQGSPYDAALAAKHPEVAALLQNTP